MRKFSILLGLILVAALAAASPPLAAGTPTNAFVLDVPVASALNAPQEVFQRAVGERFVVEQNFEMCATWRGSSTTNEAASDVQHVKHDALERVADDPLLE